MKCIRLMCIMYCKLYNGRIRTANDPKCPQVGDEVTAVDAITVGSKNFYRLEEYPENEIFETAAFAILPDATDSEINEQGHEAIIYQR